MANGGWFVKDKPRSRLGRNRAFMCAVNFADVACSVAFGFCAKVRISKGIRSDRNRPDNVTDNWRQQLKPAASWKITA